VTKNLQDTCKCLTMAPSISTKKRLGSSPPPNEHMGTVPIPTGTVPRVGKPTDVKAKKYSIRTAMQALMAHKRQHGGQFGGWTSHPLGTIIVAPVGPPSVKLENKKAKAIHNALVCENIRAEQANLLDEIIETADMQLVLLSASNNLALKQKRLARRLKKLVAPKAARNLEETYKKLK
jgi:hypothetical protein